MASESDTYLAVLKASYDYEPQPDAEDELALKENQLLFLLERTDDDWWKVKAKADTQDEDGPTGLVPSAYVEPADHIQVVKALYDYEAGQPGELSVHEDEILLVFGKEDDWLLVQSQNEEGRVGYVPGNYVEETTADAAASHESSAASSPPVIDVSSIVIPDSPPKPAYTDPAELVNRSKAKGPSGTVETWSVSEVDKKGKKKKGTLGVGNGAMFFASESDKTPVQKWSTTDIISTRIEKSKHVHVEVGGSAPISLHFHAGSKDVADAINAKLEDARLPTESSPTLDTPTAVAIAEPPEERPRSAAQKSVHFDSSEPEIIPSREEDEVEEEDADADEHAGHVASTGAGGGERAVVLYDFTADGDDEMTVHEGETLLVLEHDADDWWKCQDAKGNEGVVPANYLELVPGSGGAVASHAVETAEDDTAAQAAQMAREKEARERREREEAERKEKERKKADAEQRAKESAAAAEADRRRREQEREKQREQKERAAAAAAAAEERQKRESETSPKPSRDSKASSTSRASTDKRPPPTDGVRVWHDRTGQFRVEAAFLGFSNGKLRLHKVNGVIIEVPQEKMSAEDLRYVEKAVASRQQAQQQQGQSPPPARASSAQQQQQPKRPTVDWFEFFLSAGCDVDDCTRYAHSFERDKIDEAILPDITESTMRSLGLREGDIIRVRKAIEQRAAKPPQEDGRAEQLRRDEELARKLQAEEGGGSTRAQPPNLFASGPNGALKQRRGRPQPSSSTPPATVDLKAISSASDKIRSGTPVTTSPSSTVPPRPGSAANAVASGFDDDAWTNRPSSTKPIPPSSPANARPASVPPLNPTPAPPPAPAPPAVAAPAVPTIVAPAPPTSAPPAPAPPALTTSLANKTEADVFDQLARLSALKTVPPPVMNRPVSAAPSLQPSLVSPPLVNPPVGYATGMGLGATPGTLAQHLQAQQTGLLPPAGQFGPRGPLAPIPANQSLLQPLVPTATGFNSFVPTRPQSAPFQPTGGSFLAPQATGFNPQAQPSFNPQAQPSFNPQAPANFNAQAPPSFNPQQQPSFSLQPQPTGFQQPPMMAQPTGFQPTGPILPQSTGMQGGAFGPPQLNGGLNTLPPFQGAGSFSPVQSNPTGFNPGFGQFGAVASPPPAPPAPNTNPANVFAQMKSGTFGSDNNSGPQDPNKYDALRPAPAIPITAQATGWNAGFQGYTSGYGYQR